MPKPSKQGYVPTYPQFRVEFGDGEFSSGLRTTKAFKEGDYLAPLDPALLTKGPKAYTSVQCGPGPDDHIELNSDLVYINHSCEPNVAFDLSSPDPSKWHIRALTDLENGQFLTFFYPSTEWDMDQPFTCVCKAKTCLGQIQGAKYLTRNQLTTRRYVAPYILQLVDQRGAAEIQSRL